MSFKNLARFSFILLMFAGGLYLLLNPGKLTPETSARNDAMLALGPAGVRFESNTTLNLSEPAEPSIVNLKDIPPGVYDPDNQLDRWQRGEIDLDREEGIVGKARAAELQAAALKLPVSPTLLNMVSSSNAPSLANPGFDSIDYTECCGGGGNVPPDPELAVGKDHVLAAVNVAFEIYDKSGTSLYGPVTFSSFMAGTPGCTGLFDPNALYDEEADRFILGIDANGAGYCLAVTQTGDPTGAWNIYFFNTGTGFFDYPHAGVGLDAIYMGSNIFSGGFLESRLYAYDKWAMYEGNPAASVSFSLPNSDDTPQPVNLHGYVQNTWPTSGPHYIFTETNYNGADFSVWAWDEPFNLGIPTKVGTVNLPSVHGGTVGFPVNVPQSGGLTLQANDYRPQDFEYRNGYAWSVMTVACNPGGGTVDCLQWAQIDLPTASIVQTGLYASTGQFRFFGDLAVDACDNMAVGYTKSSTSMFPSVWVTGRQSDDPLGTLGTEIELKAGEITYTAFDGAPRRWGDYTGMTIDPDGKTFWYLGQYSKDTGTTSGRWGTWIGSLTYGCDTPPSVTIISPSPDEILSGTVTINVDAIDDIKVEQVEFFAGDSSLGSDSDGLDGWSFDWDTTLQPNGPYTLTVTATDTISQTSSASSAVIVLNNSSPVAAFDYLCEGLTCVFDGAGSYDLDGSITNFAWDFGDSGAGSGETTTYTYTVSGIYTVQLTVSDDKDAIGTFSTDITLDTLPMVSISAPEDGASVSEMVTITAEAEDDIGIIQVEFFVDDVSIFVDTEAEDGYSAIWDASLMDEGTYVLKVTATDTINQMSSASITVIVENNQAPLAAFTYTCVGMTCNFDGSGSVDSDGAISAYAWDFGDGSAGSGVTASYTYSGAGSFKVVLTVTDNKGATDTTTKTIVKWITFIPVLINK